MFLNVVQIIEKTENHRLAQRYALQRIPLLASMIRDVPLDMWIGWTVQPSLCILGLEKPPCCAHLVRKSFPVMESRK